MYINYLPAINVSVAPKYSFNINGRRSSFIKNYNYPFKKNLFIFYQKSKNIKCSR